MTTIENKELGQFDFVQQDQLLADMQAQALRDFRAATSIIERSSAIVSFSEAAKARKVLSLGVRQQQCYGTGQQIIENPDRRTAYERLNDSPQERVARIMADRERSAYVMQGVTP